MFKAEETGVIIDIVDGKLPESYEFPIPDHRSNKPTILFDQQEKRTHLFQKVIESKTSGSAFSIAIPNEIALALSVSGKAERQAMALLEQLSQVADHADKAIYDQEVVHAYDYLECVQTCIVFSYKSVESFCNASIPDDFVFEKTNHKGVVENYPKTAIERWISTSEKVSEILPAILKTQNPKNEPFWANFKNLERLRNEIIHSKSSSNADVIAELFSEKIGEYLSLIHI